MKKNKLIIALTLVLSFLLVGCGSNSSETTPTPDANATTPTPTPEATPEMPETKEGYIIVNRGGDEGMVDGVFKHNHELDFDSFIGDYSKANSTSPGKICAFLKANPTAIEDYAASNGEVPMSKKKAVTWDAESSLEYQAQMVTKVTAACPEVVATFKGE